MSDTGSEELNDAEETIKRLQFEIMRLRLALPDWAVIIDGWGNVVCHHPIHEECSRDDHGRTPHPLLVEEADQDERDDCLDPEEDQS